MAARLTFWISLLGLGLCLFLVLTCRCATPGPVPPVVPDAAPATDARPDPYRGHIFDCSFVDTTQWRPFAATCGDVENTASCMLDWAEKTVDPTPLICAARDVEVAGFLEIAKGTASQLQEHRARSLRAWLATTGATLRSAQ